MHRESIRMHHGKSCIASQYACIVENHILRANIHASRNIMHCKLMSKNHGKIIHRKKLCIMRRFHTLQNLCITRRFHASSNFFIAIRFHTSSKFMHREKISYLAEIKASPEDFIPLRNICIARRFHPSQKLMHHEKISFVKGSYASWENT